MRLEHLLFREEANEFGVVFMLFLFLDAFVEKSSLQKSCRLCSTEVRESERDE